jgi:hypothetical protein
MREKVGRWKRRKEFDNEGIEGRSMREKEGRGNRRKEYEREGGMMK